jgi:nitrite reductase/ring-hydroxylating ferredoxin subunit/Fe-S cluster biogenesis protein NfuA
MTNDPEAAAAAATGAAATPAPAPAEPPPAKTPEQLADAVDHARQQLASLDEDIRKRADQLVEAREAFMAAGVREMVRRLKADERAREVLFELVDDPLVYAVLMELGIVRPDIMTRVARAMERIKPYVKSHGGDIELRGIEGDVAYVKLHGSCSGCSMSAETLRDGVGEAITSMVPEITRVEEVKDGPVAGIVSLTVSAGAGQDADHGWHEGPAADSVSPETPVRFRAGETDVLVVRRDDRLFAYRNECPHQGLPLHEGTIDGETITCPFHGFCFELESGECRTAPQVQLEPFPLRVRDGMILVRPEEGTTA